MGTTLTVSLLRPERPVAACFSPSRIPSINPPNHRNSSTGAMRCSAPSPRAPVMPYGAPAPSCAKKIQLPGLTHTRAIRVLSETVRA